MKTNLKKLVISAFASIILLTGVFISSAGAQTFIIRKHRVIVIPPVQYPVQYPIYQPVQPVYYPNYWVVYPNSYDWGWGYREGVDEGKDDAEDGKAMNPTIHSDFYKSGSYTYQQAFIQGYYDGYLRKVRD